MIASFLSALASICSTGCRQHVAAWVRVLISAAVSVAIAGAALAQFRRAPRTTVALRPNIPYDGRFTFVRLNYTTAPGGYFYRGEPAWAHGYPIAEQNLMAIMNEVSFLGPHVKEINSLRLDDPALFRYPIAYVIEPDWWTMTDNEAHALRDYLQKGGFLIVDDFKGRNFRGGGGWEVFEQNMKRALPQGRFVDLDISHPIFHSFFEIKSLDIPQAYVNGDPLFRGLFEENDPTKRLQIMVNFNTDISQFWEWSGTGFRSISDTNESYKLGVNYLIYGLTH
jgi:uncharacterized protein DUF4159